MRIKNLGPEGYELTVAPDSSCYGHRRKRVCFTVSKPCSNCCPRKCLPRTRHPMWPGRFRASNRGLPRFKWRGLMLDVSRHFYDKSEVEAILDTMVMHKLNVFHWHLTDDQGCGSKSKNIPSSPRSARGVRASVSSSIQNPRRSMTRPVVMVDFTRRPTSAKW